MEHEALKQKFELLKTKHSTLQYELDADREESRQKYIIYDEYSISISLIVTINCRETSLEEKNTELSKELALLQENYKNAMVRNTVYSVYNSCI